MLLVDKSGLFIGPQEALIDIDRLFLYFMFMAVITAASVAHKPSS